MQVSPRGHGESSEHKELQLEALRAVGSWPRTDQRSTSRELRERGQKGNLMSIHAPPSAGLREQGGKEKKTHKRLWHGCILKKSQPCKTRWLQVYLFKAQFTFCDPQLDAQWFINSGGEGVGNHEDGIQTHPDEAENLLYTTQKTGQTPTAAPLASWLFCTGTVLIRSLAKSH